MFEEIAQALIDESGALAERWRTNAPAVAPRAAEQWAAADLERGGRLVAALAGALRNDPGCYDAVMRAGWELGIVAHESGSSLHFLLKELGLFEALVLYAVERTLRAREAADGSAAAGAAEGIAIARRLQRCYSTLTLAASNGFTHAYLVEQRRRYREIRHDLRNPLGTIRSAMALMTDESVPVETRESPRIRQMVTRNASSLEALIGSELSDASVQGSAFALQEVSLLGVARSVRRELRDEVSDCGCELEVSDALPTVLVDSTGLELALRSAVAGVMQVAAPGSTISIGLGDLAETRATLRVVYRSEDGAAVARLERALAFANEVLTGAGGRVGIEPGAVRLEVPVLAADAGDDVARAS